MWKLGEAAPSTLNSLSWIKKVKTNLQDASLFLHEECRSIFLLPILAMLQLYDFLVEFPACHDDLRTICERSEVQSEGLLMEDSQLEAGSWDEGELTCTLILS